MDPMRHSRPSTADSAPMASSGRGGAAERSAAAEWPEAAVDYGDMVVAKVALRDRDVYAEFDKTTHQLGFYDSEGLEYDPSLYLDDSYGDAALAMDRFLRDQTGAGDPWQPLAAPAAPAPAEGEGEGDTGLWAELRAKATAGRELEIHTYGNKFKRFKHYDGPQKRFNALVIQPNWPKDTDLRRVRGTDPGVQQTVAGGKRFEQVMQHIVAAVEAGDLGFIAIYCRAGHHRSVSCAELLKAYVYPRAAIRHLTISK